MKSVGSSTDPKLLSFLSSVKMFHPCEAYSKISYFDYPERPAQIMQLPVNF